MWSLSDVWILRMANIFNWRDLTEMIIISYLFYAISRWLVSDKQHNLVWYFYAYCFGVLGAYHLQLYTISTFLLIASPVAALIFIIFHQRTLQKNFVALKKIAQPPVPSYDWVAALMRSSLVALNNNKKVFFIIEQQDSLNSFVTCPLPINAPLQQALLDCIIASPSYNDACMLWISSNGQLLGANTRWHVEHDKTVFGSTAQELEAWQQQALFISSKIDALIGSMLPTQRTASIFINGKLAQGLSTDQAHTIISSCVDNNYNGTKKQGELLHEAFINKKSHHQRTP